MSNLQADTATLVLGGVVTALLVLGVMNRPPPPLVHPFVLGRQSLAGRQRVSSESPTYSNASTGGIRVALRPEKRVKTLKDVLEGSHSRFEGGEQGTWVKGGENVATMVEYLRAGLLSTLGPGSGTVAVLVDDPTDALLIILALSLTKHTPLVISLGSSIPNHAPVTAIIQSSSRFISAQSLSATPDAKWISVGGEGERSAVAEDLLITGKALVEGGEVSEPLTCEPSDLALTIVSDGVPLAFSHLNLTASLVSWLSMFPGTPSSTRPSIKDFIVSFHHPSTPYGLGLALFSIYTSASVAFPTLPSPSTPASLTALLISPSSRPPTLLFGSAATLSTPLYAILLEKMLGDTSFLIRYARNGKLNLLREGVVTSSTIWDRLIFSGIKAESNLTKLRAVFIEGPIQQSRSDFFRLALGVPAVSTLAHAFLLCPLASGMWGDFQRLPPPGVVKADVTDLGHVGPPTAGLEIKLRGNEADIAAGRIKGEILLRSPLLPSQASLPASLVFTDVTLPQLPAYPSTREVAGGEDTSAKWLRTGVRAEMGPEGVLWTANV